VNNSATTSRLNSQDETQRSAERATMPLGTMMIGVRRRSERE
jgi:hypothetical protein